jgi:hypothetical protein
MAKAFGQFSAAVQFGRPKGAQVQQQWPKADTAIALLAKEVICNIHYKI